jgi:hypothetical protein
MFEEEQAVCAICGDSGWANEHWFLIVENQWQDKLKVLHWSETLAWQPGVRQVCGTSHLRELVVHWMTTGSLDYPFARTPEDPFRRRKVLKSLRPLQLIAPDVSSAEQIGELAIHRESMERVLRENPQALAGILDALLLAMSPSRSLEGRGVESEMELCATHMEV